MKGPKEDVTDAFRKAVLDALKANKDRNDLSGARKGDPDYLISSHAELAEATGFDKTRLGRVIGNVRKTSKAVPINRTEGLDRIRKALQLPEMVSVSVRASRVAVIRAIAELPDESFQALADRIAKVDKSVR